MSDSTIENGSAKSPKPTVSRSLLFQAQRGKFSTRLRKPGPKTIEDEAIATNAVVENAGDGQANDADPEQTPPVNSAPAKKFTQLFKKKGVHGNTVHVSQPVVHPVINEAEDQGAHPEALDPHRFISDKKQFLKTTASMTELRINASAARSLTRLFCALSVEPGSGQEVPKAVRAKILNDLIAQSHQLSDYLCTSVTQGEIRAPTYLRAKLLTQAAHFLSEQWVKYGRTDITDLKLLADYAFGSQASNLSQEIVDLFAMSDTYTPATTQEIRQARVTESVVRESWDCLRTVQSIHMNQYDSSITEQSAFANQVFSYGRSPNKVSGDLLSIALAITQENRLDIEDSDISTNWIQNSIRRAAMLVRAEYQLLTDRALRSAFQEDLLSEAALGRINGLYDQILDKIQSRARAGFISVEKNAIQAMAATSYVHYLPKTGPAENKPADVPTETQKAEVVSDMQVNAGKDSAHNQAQPESTASAPKSTNSKLSLLARLRHV